MKIIIDGKECEASRGEFILDVARRNCIYIPTLCHSDALPGQGNCRLCIVEVIENRRRKVVTSCIYPIQREIEVVTNSEKIMKMRRTILMLLAARVPNDERLNDLRKEYAVPDVVRFNVDYTEKCILCGLCVRACDELGSGAISTVCRGVTKKVSTPYDEPSDVCIGCGSCVSVCPTGAIKVEEKNGTRTIWGKTFKLLKCSKCGEYFATPEQMEYIKNKLDMEDDIILCEKCRKRVTADKLKDIYEGVRIK